MEKLTVHTLVDFYLSDNRPVGIVVSDEVILAQAIKAVRYYAGYGDLSAFLGLNGKENKPNLQKITENTPLDRSELSVISPLFELYVERENALILEASRALGVEVYGRTISEISGDIAAKEQEIQNLAFQENFFTV